MSEPQTTASASTPGAALVRDVDEADFLDVVVEGSKTRPVVVDFWAAWCGPCRQLSPLLEQAAARYAGDVDVVKVDVDANQRLAQQFRVQGIPAVKAFADGRMVSEFTGLQPPQVIEQFFAALAPSEADKLADAAIVAVDAAQQETLLRKALELEPDHPAAALGVAAIQQDAGDTEAAIETLNRARPTPEIQQALAQLRLAGAGGASLPELRDRVAGGDDDARVELGTTLAALGQHDEAISVLLDAVRIPATLEPAREALVEVFTVLGADDPRVKQARPKLAAALF